MNKWLKLLFLGDSLTTGAREPYGMSWPYYLAHEAMNDQITVLPEIEAVNGMRSSDLIRTSLAAIRKAESSEAFILIGTNDTKESGALPAELTVTNVRLLVAWCQSLNVRPYVLTVPLPSGFGSPGYTAAAVDRVREINRGLRKAGFAHLVDCEDVRNTVDGIHLDSVAAQCIAKRAWDAIKTTRTFA